MGKANTIKLKTSAVLIMLMVGSMFGQEKEMSGKVVGVHDGDSITLLTSGKLEVKVRLEGIDAPELKQAYGNASKKSLSDLVFGQQVRLEVTGKDRYRRILGHVFVGDTWVNLCQVKNGFAWHYKKYNKDPRLSDAELVSRDAGVGLWRDNAPVPPWNWRRKK